MSSPVRTAVITGAAQGIGKAIALRLAQDGLDIVINDLPGQAQKLDEVKSKITQETGRRCLVVLGDASEEKDVQNMVDSCVAQFGGLDVMVANAGIARTGPIVSTPIEDFDKVTRVNFRSVFLAYKAAAIQMIKQGRGGRIIGASSVSGKQGFPEFGVYGATKFAIRGLTQTAALELRPHGITVNAYAPGLVATGIWDDIAKHREDKQLGLVPTNPEWSIFPPEDVAGVVSYLVREEATYITGQAININHGMYCE